LRQIGKETIVEIDALLLLLHILFFKTL